MRTIAIANQKGGTGKTTSVVNLGVALGKLGNKVLVVDLDPQFNLTYHFGIDPYNTKSIYQVLKGKSIKNIIIEKEGINMAPANLNLGRAEVELLSAVGRESILKNALRKVKDYDYVLIDCPPSLGLLTLNALTAASEVFIPLQVETLAMQGMSGLLNTVSEIQKYLNKDLHLGGVILTLYGRRRGLSKEIQATAREHFSNKVFKTVIRINVKLAEAPGFGKSIFKYAPKSHGAEDYYALAKEVDRMRAHKRRERTRKENGYPNKGER